MNLNNKTLLKYRGNHFNCKVGNVNIRFMRKEKLWMH